MSTTSGDIDTARETNVTANKEANSNPEEPSTAATVSAEQKAEEAKIADDNLFQPLGEQQETDAFQCGRCKLWRCKYRTEQTRSAVELMTASYTTFVTCMNCNHRWMFR
ncbi:unnamed protein product [Peniophora sp. CBMAI 1063]|nr:unnamed protein product [Peniophora sp. CBMAI 1063]